MFSGFSQVALLTSAKNDKYSCHNVISSIRTIADPFIWILCFPFVLRDFPVF